MLDPIASSCGREALREASIISLAHAPRTTYGESCTISFHCHPLKRVANTHQNALLLASNEKENRELREFLYAKRDPNLLKDKKIAVMATDGVEELELTIPLQYFRDLGATTHLISPFYKPLSSNLGVEYPPARKTHILTVRFMENAGWAKIDRYLNEVKASDYDALLIAGGAWNPDNLRVDEDALRIASNMYKTGKPVAAICHGPLVLVNAELLKGKKVTSFWNVMKDLENAGATVIDQAVVVDKNLITSRYPYDLPDLLKEIIKQLQLRGRGIADQEINSEAILSK